MEDREELLKLINQLEPLDQKVFIMKYLLGMKTEEIGDKLGLTQQSIIVCTVGKETTTKCYEY